MHKDQKIVRVGQSLSKSLRDSIKARYGRIPSAAFLSREFNMRYCGLKEISSESFRRWVRGYSVPRPDHLQVLVNWLNLDLNQLYCSKPNNGPEPPLQTLVNRSTKTQEISQLMHVFLAQLNDAQRQEVSAIISLLKSHSAPI